MLLETALITGLHALPLPTPVGEALDDDPLAPLTDETVAHLRAPLPRERSKKEAWISEKAARPDVHFDDAALARALATAHRRPRPRPRRAPAATAADLPDRLSPPGTRIEPVTTLYNLWTREALPIVPGLGVEERFHLFLRDHFTNQAKPMDARLVDVLVMAAQRFRAARIEVVSGYRSPKYNLMLRKKGREVARSSQHTEGHAVDFRIRGVPTMTLLKYVRSLRRGGVGYYPRSQFVHTDTGRVRFWKGS